MARDPHHITYTDLIDFVEAKVRFMEKNNDRLRLEGSLSAWTAIHNKACAEKLLQLLKKYEKIRQGDLFEAFQNIRSR